MRRRPRGRAGRRRLIVDTDLLITWLRPSALEGAWALACAARMSGSEDINATARLLSTTYSSAGFDFEAAQQILDEVSPWSFDRAEFFRSVFFEAMRRTRPPALSLTPRGRTAFAGALPEDATECLRRCGVLDLPPDAQAVRWFDSLASFARSELEQRRMDVAREAERRSLAVEHSWLDPLPGRPNVEWVALDDNGLGYDIRSYERSEGTWMPKLIEVKACAGGSLEFYLTRNESLVARRQPDRYCLHLWNLDTDRFVEVRWPDIEPLLPADTSQGQWTEARLRWATSLI